MNSFFLEYRDPLFSIIIFFAIIFIITFFSYWWSRYKSREDSKYLDDFLKQFRSLPSKDELSVLISSGEISEKSWLLLAHSYYDSGEYEKSIEIYNEILNVGSIENKKETRFLLGKTYFKAGFLERSKQIFLSILKVNPRTPQALKYLLLVHEYMRDYKSALEVLEPLEALHKDIKLDSIYLQTLDLLNSVELSPETKVATLVALYKEHHELTYLIFEYLFRVNPAVAWENFDSSKSAILVDLLWRVKAKDLNLDIISQNGFLRELYSARGDITLAKNSAIFEFDVLINLQGKSNATLNFEYICENCKQVFPFVFNRCTSCHAIDSAKVEWSLCKDYYKDVCKENNSFQ